MVSCPECASQNVYRDGIRYSASGKIQRWLCRKCGYRFTEGHNNSRTNRAIETDSQVCVILQEAKNLATATESKTVAGDRKLDKAATKGLLLQYALYLEKEGYGSGSKYPSHLRSLLMTGCDVYDPESVKAAIAKKKVKNGTKMLCCYAYDALAKMLDIKWDMPTYHQEKHIFFLPEESELDALINATKSQRLRTYLQTLKETWPDPSEGLGIRWIDVDFNRNIIAINHPVKDHLPREIQVSPRPTSMISNLPRTSEYVYPMKYTSLASAFKRLRKRVAHNIQNPRILSIKLTSYRHWGGTQLAWLSNGNTLFVKEKLGHNCVESTMKYIAKINWKITQDFEVVTATTDEDIKKCGEAGFQKYDERTVGSVHVSYYRRPKHFGTMKI